MGTTTRQNYDEAAQELVTDLRKAIEELIKKSHGEAFDQQPLKLLGIFLGSFAGNIEEQSLSIVHRLEGAMHMIEPSEEKVDLAFIRNRILTESHRLLSDPDEWNVADTEAALTFCKVMIAELHPNPD